MKVYSEISLENFEAWSGAVDTLNNIRNAGKCDELEAILEDAYPDGMDETQLNDILWFEPEWCYEMCGMPDPDAEEEEEDDEDEEDKEEVFQNFCDGHDDCIGCPYEKCKTMQECKEAFYAENN